MPLPQQITTLINATHETGQELLAQLAKRGVNAGQEGVAALNYFRAFMERANERFLRDTLNASDFQKIVESESEAVKFKLAAIAAETARAALSDLLSASLKFLGQILGVAAGAMR